MTSITLKQEVKDALADEKPEDMSWSDYLESVAIGGVGDLEAFGGSVPPMESSGISYDDVKAACEAAIREEMEDMLPP